VYVSVHAVGVADAEAEMVAKGDWERREDGVVALDERPAKEEVESTEARLELAAELSAPYGAMADEIPSPLGRLELCSGELADPEADGDNREEVKYDVSSVLGLLDVPAFEFTV
jgi:hypothetical protein